MARPATLLRAPPLALAFALPVLVPAARAEGPVYKDAERFQAHRPAPDIIYEEALRRRGPPRRVTGGPGYAGSEYGLGKPAFSGLGSRPDWGRSSE